MFGLAKKNRSIPFVAWSWHTYAREALSHFPRMFRDCSHVRTAPKKDDVFESASRTVVVVNIICDDGDAATLIVRQPTHRNDQSTGREATVVIDEPTRIFLPIILCPLVMQRCHVGGVSSRLVVSAGFRVCLSAYFCFWCGSVCTLHSRFCVAANAKQEVLPTVCSLARE